VNDSGRTSRNGMSFVRIVCHHPIVLETVKEVSFFLFGTDFAFGGRVMKFEFLRRVLDGWDIHEKRVQIRMFITLGLAFDNVLLDAGYLEACSTFS